MPQNVCVTFQFMNNVNFYDKMWTDIIIVLWNFFQQSLLGMYTVPISVCKTMFQAFSPICDSLVMKIAQLCMINGFLYVC